ncbi:UNVERIFIED_CONTAM: hypothetical protein FKN15_044910 [Acipenser sinensis]
MGRCQKRSECCRDREQQQSLPGSAQRETTLNCRIPEHLVTRLQLKHILEIVKQDPICLVGEVLKDLPKLSDDPSKIWHALIKKEQVT